MINNTIELLEHEKDTCIEALSRVLNQEDMEECKSFIINLIFSFKQIFRAGKVEHRLGLKPRSLGVQPHKQIHV